MVQQLPEAFLSWYVIGVQKLDLPCDIIIYAHITLAKESDLVKPSVNASDGDGGPQTDKAKYMDAQKE